MKTIINIDFSGFFQVDFSDLKLRTNEDIPVDLNTLTPEETMAGIKSGKYFIQFGETYAHALDGETEITASIDGEG